MSKKKKPLVFSLEELERKGTKELLGYLNRLRKCEESFELSDCNENPDLLNSSKIFFKQTDKWKIAYKNVKYILNSREHVD